MITYVPVSSFNSPNTRKTQTNGSKFGGGLPSLSGAGALALCGEAEGAGLSKSEEELAPGDPGAASLVSASAGRVLRRPFTVVHGGAVRDSRHHLKQEMFRLDKRRSFISRRTVKLWSRLPREVVQIKDIQMVFDCSPSEHGNYL